PHRATSTCWSGSALITGCWRASVGIVPMQHPLNVSLVAKTTIQGLGFRISHLLFLPRCCDVYNAADMVGRSMSLTGQRICPHWHMEGPLLAPLRPGLTGVARAADLSGSGRAK